jgi:hypothetical protein
MTPSFKDLYSFPVDCYQRLHNSLSRSFASATPRAFTTMKISSLLTLACCPAWVRATPMVRSQILILQLTLITKIYRLIRDFRTDSEQTREEDCRQFNIATVVALIAHAYLSTWLHEQGHVLAMRACLRGVRPEVEIDLFGYGATYPMEAAGLTPFGAMLGKRGTALLIATGGILSSVAVSIISRSIAKHAPPDVSVALDSLADWQIIREVWPIIKRQSSDLQEIQKNGGTAAAAIAVALLAASLFFPAISSSSLSYRSR